MIDTQRLIAEAGDLGVAVSPEQAALLDAYSAAVVEANRQMNLTAITEPREVAVKHLLDCLTLCTLTELRGRMADIGTGAGFPGVLLKILRPELDVTLIDATGKKLAFVQRTCDAMGIAVTTLHGRAEELARKEQRESFDTVTARAVAALPSLLEYALPLVAVGGHLIAMKGPEAEAELAAATYALKQLGGSIAEVANFTLPGDIRRSAVVIRKDSATPPQYPRSGKNIAKSPLGEMPSRKGF